MKPPATTARIRLPLGPATLAAVALAIILARQLPDRAAVSREPGVTRTTVEIAPEGRLSSPDPAWLLEQAARLKLTRSQRARLARLEGRWKRETRVLRDELARASAEFQGDAAAADGKPVTLRRLQERARPVSLLSGQLLSARHAWWSEASRDLNAAQRLQVEALWAGRFTQHSRSKEMLR